MKLIVFLLLWMNLHGAPKICLNMIVKNESHVIRRCLESVKPLIDTWVIVDTGSTDGTQEVIKELLKDIPGELHERPWVNFAHNRNEALQLAKSKADYLLFIDADDILQIDPGFKKPILDKDFYELKLQWDKVTFKRICIIKTSLPWVWQGVVHETISCPQSQTSDLLAGVTMVVVGGGGRSHDPKKHFKDALLLEKALQEEPSNKRYVFYLAQCYQAAKMYDLALTNYRRHVEMGGTGDDIEWSLYQIACLQDILDLPEEVVSKGYLTAYQSRPDRAEPLYRLSSYYRKKEKYLLGYLLAKQALLIPCPNQAAFKETWVYEYGIKLEYSICAYWVGRFEESYNACKDLLKMSTNLPLDIRECVEKNLSFAQERLTLIQAP